MSYRHPPDHDGDGYRDQSERALHPWDSAQSGQQTQLPRGGQEPQLQYPPQQSYDQQPPWNPYNQSDPGQWQGQPAWQDQAYQGQPYQGQPPYAPQQPPFTPDSRYGPPSGQPPYQHQAQYPGTPRGQLYPQALPQRYAPGQHRQRLYDQADPSAWPQPHRRKRFRSLVYAGTATLIVIVGAGAGYALAGHRTGGASSAQPLSCKQQYSDWKTGPANAQGKQLDADLSKVSAAGSAEDITTLTSALKAAGADATALERYPMPVCADPDGYWGQMLARIKAAGDNAGSASGLGGILLAEAPLKQVPGLEQKLSAELKRAAITGKS